MPGNRAPAKPPLQSPLRVLHVEDDRVAALLFAEALRHEPAFELQLAETPTEALAMATEWPPHLLVLDAQLPGMSGHALLPCLRALPGLAGVPAYMCSADTDAAAQQTALAAGFDGYWPKPVTPNLLVRRLRRLAAGQPADPDGEPSAA